MGSIKFLLHYFKVGNSFLAVIALRAPTIDCEFKLNILIIPVDWCTDSNVLLKFSDF